MKAHIGADKSGLVHSVVGTAANVPMSLRESARNTGLLQTILSALPDV